MQKQGQIALRIKKYQKPTYHCWHKEREKNFNKITFRQRKIYIKIPKNSKNRKQRIKKTKNKKRQRRERKGKEEKESE